VGHKKLLNSGQFSKTAIRKLLHRQQQQIRVEVEVVIPVRVRLESFDLQSG
jgi:hypothetical protein